MQVHRLINLCRGNRCCYRLFHRFLLHHQNFRAPSPRFVSLRPLDQCSCKCKKEKIYSCYNNISYQLPPTMQPWWCPAGIPPPALPPPWPFSATSSYQILLNHNPKAAASLPGRLEETLAGASGTRLLAWCWRGKKKEITAQSRKN